MNKPKWLKDILFRYYYLPYAGAEFRWGLLCGKIGEWFLWQQWKQCTDRKEFDRAIRRLRGITEKEYLSAQREIKRQQKQSKEV